GEHTHWSSLHGNLQNTQVVSVALDDGHVSGPSDDVILAGTQDNGSVQHTATGGWIQREDGDGHVVLVDESTPLTTRYFTFFGGPNPISIARDDFDGTITYLKPTVVNTPGTLLDEKFDTSLVQQQLHVNPMPFELNAADLHREPMIGNRPA